jgi:predicted transcriptional regulator
MEKRQEEVMMKVMEIGIKSLNEGWKDFEEAFLAAKNRTPFKPRKGVYFTSLEAVRNFLTPKRIELLHVIKEKSPKSLYELAKFAGRGFPSVVRDVNILSRHGLIRLTNRAASPRKKVHPEVLYDAISLWIGI